jgi:hypothetical protein
VCRRNEAMEKTMAKGQLRSNKETRKPKADKPKPAAASKSAPAPSGAKDKK